MDNLDSYNKNTRKASLLENKKYSSPKPKSDPKVLFEATQLCINW